MLILRWVLELMSNLLSDEDKGDNILNFVRGILGWNIQHFYVWCSPKYLKSCVKGERRKWHFRWSEDKSTSIVD